MNESIEQAKAKVTAIINNFKSKYTTFYGLESLPSAHRLVEIYGAEQEKLDLKPYKGNRWIFFQQVTEGWNSVVREQLREILAQLLDDTPPGINLYDFDQVTKAFETMSKQKITFGFKSKQNEASGFTKQLSMF